MRILLAVAAVGAALASVVPAAAAGERGERLAVTALDASLHGERLRLSLALSRTTAFELFTLEEPRRLVLDLPPFDWWAGDGPVGAPYVSGLRRGLFRPGQARLVFDLTEPVRVERAFTLPAAPARAPRLVVDLVPTTAKNFAATAGWPADRRWTGDTQATRRLRVALDPGHGGHDPGAMAEGLVEKNLVLDFAREVAAAIAARPDMEPILIREEDVYVPLAVRIERARAAGADLMISLHADQVAEGEVDGISVYSLGRDGARRRSPEAMTGELIRGRDRSHLVGDLDLEGESDALARTLVGLARRSTHPESERLASTLLSELEGAVALLASRPHRHGAFTVLKAADMPAVLVELGFMDSATDRRRFASAEWRKKTIAALIGGIESWAATIAAPGMAVN